MRLKVKSITAHFPTEKYTWEDLEIDMCGGAVFKDHNGDTIRLLNCPLMIVEKD